ncbi:MAG: Asparagine synthetase [glutamine-hydrolyzing] 1 [Myxococcota bacterium]|nr:Asparagine synthetase [glutamine-hydrolyzing] 1 [Myxococcota bacterium]
MARLIAHRGPDDEGFVYLGERNGRLQSMPENGPWAIGLAHRRLSILDLSPAGHQPMQYRDRYWTVYNGEAYNYLEVRAELEKLGHRFQSGSDTEVLLAACAQWGPDFIQRFRGMWALAIVDTVEQSLLFTRDRTGIKPLFIWETGDYLAAASEIKAFMELPGFLPRLNADMAVSMIQMGNHPSGTSFFEGVRVFPPGRIRTLNLRKMAWEQEKSYWFPEKVAVNRGFDHQSAGEAFKAKLAESISLHLRSDVPVGAALSGGLDSSTLAAWMVNQRKPNDPPVHTFSTMLGGDDIRSDRPYIETMNRVLKASPHFDEPSWEQAEQDLERFIWSQDEPVPNASMLMGYSIARLVARAQVVVVINGQGADELLAGYWPMYLYYLQNEARQANLRPLVTHALAAAKKSGNRLLLSELFIRGKIFFRRSRGGIRFEPRGHYQREVVYRTREMLRQTQDHFRLFALRESSLPNLLRYEDRNSMAFSVEGRYPYLDHELIELCLSFPMELLFKDGWTKYPLRLAAEGMLPKEITWRKTKYGWESPQHRWFHQEARPMLEAWLNSIRPAWDIVERESARKVAENAWKTRDLATAESVFQLYLFDRWLERFNVRTAQ